MMETTPKITTTAILVHFPPKLSSLPVHLSITQLLPSTSLLLHVTTNRNQPRLSDVFVVSMPRGKEVLSSRLEGLGGLDDDIDRLARLLCISRSTYADFSETIRTAVFCFWGAWKCCEGG